jgi:hypothetical protein
MIESAFHYKIQISIITKCVYFSGQVNKKTTYNILLEIIFLTNCGIQIFR